MSEKTHALFSPSSSHIWTACPGSIPLSKDAPPEEETEAAKEGTRAHELLERSLEIRVRDVMGYFKKEYPYDMRLHVQKCVEFLYGLEKKEKGTIVVEEKVYMTDVHPTECSGTKDVEIVSPDILHGIDFKYGKAFVSAKDNTQLLLYIIGTLEKYPGRKFKKIKTSIYQPRSNGKPFRTETYTMADIEKWKKFFQKAVDRAVLCVKGEQTYPGHHCFFCKGKADCPSIKKKRDEKVLDMFEDLSATTD